MPLPCPITSLKPKTLRDGERFYDTEAYGRAVSTIDAALRVISAAYTPLSLDFTAYRTPFAMTSPAEIAHDSEAEHDPFAACAGRADPASARRVPA